MTEWHDIGEVTEVGLSYLILTVATVVFAVRVIHLIETEGRADKGTMWRLAALRVSAFVFALSGGTIVLLCFSLVLNDLFGVPPIPIGDPAQQAMLSFIPVAFLLAAFCGLLFAVGDYGPAALRSFAALRWLGAWIGAARSSFFRWRPARRMRAFLRKHDRRLW